MTHHRTHNPQRDFATCAFLFGAGDGESNPASSLGISLPCQVIPTDLRMACTVAYRTWPLLTLPYSAWTARLWLSCHDREAAKKR
jgi:hypothetical protein